MAVVRTPSGSASLGLLACAIGGCVRDATDAVAIRPAPTSSLVAPLGGQTETDWGVIWDTLPADFPVYAGRGPVRGVGERSRLREPGRGRRGPRGRRHLDRLGAVGRGLHDHRGARVDGGREHRPRGRSRDRLPRPRHVGTARFVDVDHHPVRWRVPEPVSEGASDLKPRRRDFFGAAMLFIVLISLVAVIVIGNIPA